MEVSCQLHAPATLPPHGKEPKYPLNKKLGGPRTGPEILEKTLSLAAAGIRTTVRPTPWRSRCDYYVLCLQQHAHLSPSISSSLALNCCLPTHCSVQVSAPLSTVNGASITLGRTRLDEWSTRHGYLYVTNHNTYKIQTTMPLVEFEPAIPASERQQNHALVRAATRITSPLWTV